jgi:uncharacterized membrane protein
LADETKEVTYMKVKFLEILLVALVVIPLALLFYMWSSIPETIPVHYGWSGEPNRFDNKSILIWFIPLVMIFSYSIMALVPRIDPKNRVTYNQRGYYSMRLAVSLFHAILFSSYILSIAGDWNFSRTVPLLIMALLIVLGNYMPVLKPNYFIGVRTPWTLENTHVWKKTHRFCGRLLVAGGLVGLIMHLVWPSLSLSFSVGLIVVLAVLSVSYSYVTYRKSDSAEIND